MNSGPDAFAALRRHGSHNAMFQLVGNIALHRDCHAAVGVRPPRTRSTISGASPLKSGALSSVSPSTKRKCMPRQRGKEQRATAGRNEHEVKLRQVRLIPY